MTTGTDQKERPGERSRDSILRTAANVATIHGLEGITIGTLAAHIGMSKSALHARFGSKEQLQLETVETAREIFDADVVAPTEAIADPLERLRALYERFLQHIEQRVFPGGCFFASVTAEFDTHPGPVKDRISSVQGHWTEHVEHLIREAQAAGALDPAEDAAQLAFELDAFVLRGNTDFVLHDDPVFLARARSALSRRLELSAPTASPRPRRTASASPS